PLSPIARPTETAELFDRVLFEIVSVPWFRIAPPVPPWPLLSVRRSRLAVTPASTLKTLLDGLPLMITPLADPTMWTSLASSNGLPPTIVIVFGPGPGMLNVIVPPMHVSSSAWRRLPAPLSAVVVTSVVAEHALTVCDSVGLLPPAVM